MARNVKQEVVRAIQRKLVISTMKTKPRDLGGRQLVSVGPYQEATGAKSYVVITKNDVAQSLSADAMAREFVDFVGRDHAWAALRRAYAKKGLTDEIARLDRSI